MSDYLIDLLTGTKSQEDLIWRMVEAARKYTDKSEIEISTIIRQGLNNLSGEQGETLQNYINKPIEERFQFAKQSFERLIHSLDLNTPEKAYHEALVIYEQWLQDHLSSITNLS